MSFYMCRYIRRRDGSPIMEALALWRHETLRKRTDKSASPLTLEESNESSRRLSKEGNSGKNDATMTSNQPVNMPEPPVQEPSSLSSSSWVQWWRSSRKNQANGDAPLSVSICPPFLLLLRNSLFLSRQIGRLHRFPSLPEIRAKGFLWMLVVNRLHLFNDLLITFLNHLVLHKLRLCHRQQRRSMQRR